MPGRKKPLTFSVFLVYNYNIILSLYRFLDSLPTKQDSGKQPGSNREAIGSGWRANVTQRNAGVLFSSTFSPSVTRKFQKNFRKISPLFHRPCNRFLDEKMRYRGVLKSLRNFFKNRKKFLHFYANFLFRLPIKLSSK